MSDASQDLDHHELTRANEVKALAAEAAPSYRVEAAPMKITFEFTGDCDLHCFFCECEFIRDKLREQGIHQFAMDEGRFRHLVETTFPHVSLVTPTGVGEIFTFRHFDLLIDYAQKYTVKLEIFTNGMLLKEPHLSRMLPNLYRLAISFDGGTKETFELVRTGSKFSTVVENLRVDYNAVVLSFAHTLGALGERRLRRQYMLLPSTGLGIVDGQQNVDLDGCAGFVTVRFDLE